MPELINIASQAYDIGRAAIFRAPYWDGTTNLFDDLLDTRFQHLGNTEGEIAFAPNAEYSSLMIPENLGPGVLKKYLTGFAPTAEFGMFPSPTLSPILSPTGAASGGNTRQRRVKLHTLWIAPEQLFIKPNAVTNIEEEVEVTVAAGVWSKDGEAFTAEDQRLFDMSIFIWMADFTQMMPTYRHEDGGKSLTTVTLSALQDLTKAEGHQIWTMGSELVASGIDLEAAGS